MAKKDVGELFVEKMSQIRGGQALHDVYKGMKEANLSVLENGKDAIVTLKIVVKADKHDENAVNFHPKVSVKLPEKVYAPGVFYVDRVTGEPTREDPRQMQLLADQEAEREAEKERQRAEGIAHLDRVGRGNGTDG